MAERGRPSDFRQQQPYLSLTKEQIADHIARIRDLTSSLTDLCFANGCEKDTTITISTEQAMLLISAAQTWANVTEQVWMQEGFSIMKPKH
jgi:hypothetical protein